MKGAMAWSTRLDALAPRAGTGRLALRAGRIVLACAIGLTVLGCVMLYSWGSARDLLRPDMALRAGLGRQIQWVFLAVLAGGVASAVRLETLRRWIVPLFSTTLVLLGVVLLFGPRINGSHRWLRLLGFSLQPSEILKVAVVIYLADRLARREEERNFDMKLPLLSMLAPVGLGILLVFVEPDLGTALFLVAETVVLLAIAGVRPTRLFPFAITVAPLLTLYAYTRFGHVRRRLAGPGEQVIDSLIAIGSGGVTGVGLGAGLHKLGYVPEIQTDFAFALVGEELGFLGCAAVIVTFMILTWFGSRLAGYARAVGPFACYLAAGAVFLVSFQALINIAVVTGMAPTKGIALPFLSRGGSNLVMMGVAVGLLVNVAHRTAEATGEVPFDT